MLRTASAVWSGNLKNGKGYISTQSGAMDGVQYGFNTRFEDGPGTNPEELIAAAHAGCFTMALAAQLSEAGIVIESLRTNAAVTLEKLSEGYVITTIKLSLIAKLPGADHKLFEKVANKAKLNCPVSKLLKAAIILETTFEA